MIDPHSSPEDTVSAVEGETPKRRSVGQIVFGLVLVGAGLAWLIAATDVIDVPWRAVLATALIIIGIAIAVSAKRPRHGGLVAAGVILTIVLALISTGENFLDLPLSGGIGERTYNPTNLAAVESEYRLGLGQLVVDVGEVTFPAGETRIEASVTLGSLIIVVPDDVAVHVEARVTAGEVRILGTDSSGTSIDEVVEDDGYAEAETRLLIDASAGLGEVEVRR